MNTDKNKNMDKESNELVFCGGGFWAEPGLYGHRGDRKGGIAGWVRLCGAGVPERGCAAVKVPGADPAGDSVSRGGGASGGIDAGRATGGAVPPGGGRDGSGEAGGGSAAAGEAGGGVDAGDDHERANGDDGAGVPSGAEAGPDYRVTGVAAARGVADRRGVVVCAEAGGGDGGHGSEGVGGGERTVCGVAGGDARRPGVRGGVGVLERAEGVSERSAGG